MDVLDSLDPKERKKILKELKKQRRKQKSKEIEPNEGHKKKRTKKKRQKMGKQEEKVFGYTNDDNPFGDSNLTQVFVWKKKKEKELNKGIITEDDIIKEQKKKREELHNEIMKVKKAREQREYEKKIWEEEKARLERQEGLAKVLEMNKKDHEFHLQQAKYRTHIRIKEGREHPIDKLYKSVTLDLRYDIDTQEPYKLFEVLDLSSLEQLSEEIKTFIELGDVHKSSWIQLQIICEDEIRRARFRMAQEDSLIQQNQSNNFENSNHENFLQMENSKNQSNPQFLGFRSGFEYGVHESVKNDILEAITDKTFTELDALQMEVEDHMNSDDVGDIEYWEAMHSLIKLYKAKAFLREKHEIKLRKRLSILYEILEKEQKEKKEKNIQNENLNENQNENQNENLNENLNGNQNENQNEDIYSDEEENANIEILEKKYNKYQQTKNHTEKTQESTTSEYEKDDLIKGFEEFIANEDLTEAKDTSEDKPLNPLTLGDEYNNLEENEEDDDDLFTDEIQLNQQTYSWDNKYRPRKPRYFNRIKTGYEWNSYNRIHYDGENPPPKTVQGYKFNIFYPDLIDKSKTPFYSVEKTNSPEISILRFHAGPPYEDVAFKIVNREWENSRRRGFKAFFDKGVFHLWFNFRRYFYRR
ncbi:cactin [Anaeramoeba ignava]|uniref:Splicing factor Cactin n=1 Tax=Anaeramoeba ignava TaxID=1746090 RepID=A0A9Q0R885_ANAIG|nr:cactin [Anaeramoeba ignava]